MAPHFRKVEKMYFLRTMEEVLPLGSVEWETVANRHNEKYTTYPRSADSTRRQYYSLCKAMPPTGDPNVPEEVALARQIKRLITQRGDMSDGTEQYDFTYAGGVN